MGEKYESLSDGETNVSETEWSELEKLSRGKEAPASEAVDQQGSTEGSAKDKQEGVSRAAIKIKELDRKNDTEGLDSVETGTIEEESLFQEQSSPTIVRSLGRYDTAERPRVDRIKAGLTPFNIGDYKYMQITSRPSAFTKAVRLVADRLGIKTKRSEDRRNREAMHVAISEYYEEEAAREKAIEEREKAEALERERRKAEDEAREAEREAKREEEALARDMAEARDTLERNKHDRFRKQRIQEMVERGLNSHLLKIDDLEMEVVAENPEVQKRSVSFEDVEIPVYDLKGFPFSMLSTTIDFRKANEDTNVVIGINTYRRVMNDPSIWAERRDEAEKASGFGTENSDARGDTISTSYWDSEHNIDSHVSGNLIYGFASVQADSIISVHNRDGGTSNMAGSKETSLYDPDAIKQLKGANGANYHNEVLLRRYTENGIPKKPDYIIVKNGRITEESLRHAAYFGIPIVNVERSVYVEKAKKRGEELLASISEDDTYEEMDGKIAELLSMSTYKDAYNTLKYIGRNCDIPPRQTDPTPLEKRCFEVSQMEQLKRLDFIKSALEEATRKIESATEKGLPIGQAFPGFKHFSIYIEDVQKQLRRTDSSDERTSSYSAPGSCNFIDIAFRLKGSSRYVETVVYDGERMYKAEEALAHRDRTKEDIENADSSFYDNLEPVVLRYFEAMRKNREFGEA